MKLPRDYKRDQFNYFEIGSILPHLAGSIRLKAVFLSLFLLVGLVFTQLVFANNLATDGEKMAQVQAQIKKLERENMSLQAEIAEISSLTNLAQEAKNHGFVKPTTITIVERF